ncbi:hypothetical protein ElyMa_002654000 [Elysia marginata]|uniref:Apple domain-containing protein n=1 Tax=Elysia marginata TaxID=1093978 RepID=A0AAV4H843_9GAST|nr:hypothetical protein ElyMa_002654000 [Elysia marginata]
MYLLVKGAVSTNSQMKFFRNRFTGIQVLHALSADSSPPEHSAGQCAVRCRTSPPDAQSRGCNAFLYSQSTGLCEKAYTVSELESLFNAGLGDLYAGCDFGRGYRLHTVDSTTTVCLLLVTSQKVW